MPFRLRGMSAAAICTERKGVLWPAMSAVELRSPGDGSSPQDHSRCPSLTHNVRRRRRVVFEQSLHLRMLALSIVSLVVATSAAGFAASIIRMRQTWQAQNALEVTH